MAWVRFDHTVKYGNEFKEPFVPFEVDENDLKSLKNDGAEVIKVSKPTVSSEDDSINFTTKPRRKTTR